MYMVISKDIRAGPPISTITVLQNNHVHIWKGLAISSSTIWHNWATKNHIAFSGQTGRGSFGFGLFLRFFRQFILSNFHVANKWKYVQKLRLVSGIDKKSNFLSYSFSNCPKILSEWQVMPETNEGFVFPHEFYRQS